MNRTLKEHHEATYAAFLERAKTEAKEREAQDDYGMRDSSEPWFY